MSPSLLFDAFNKLCFICFVFLQPRMHLFHAFLVDSWKKDICSTFKNATSSLLRENGVYLTCQKMNDNSLIVALCEG